MNKGQEELLTILTAENDYISVEDIINRLKCSERTIRNYIKYINNWLSTFSNIFISRKSNLGIKLIDEKNEKNILHQKLRIEVKRVNSDIHRQIEILNLLLISSKTKVNLSDICNTLYINKNIAREEINKLIGLIKQKGFSLIPISLYFKGSFVKLELGIGKGKKLYDKRQDLAKKDANRQIQANLKNKQY